MADGIQFNVEGLAELSDRLEGLQYDMKRKGGRFALRRAANLIRDAAKANAARIDDPATGESIAKNIAVRWSGRTFKRTGNLKFRIGVLGGARQYANTKENVRKGRAGQTYATGGDKSNPGGDTWYWRLVEFGRGPITVKKGAMANASSGEFFGKSVAAVPARPFMRPALSQNTDAAAAEFVKQYGKALDRALKRAGKR